MHLERAEVREDHGRGVCVGRLARGLDRALRRRVECPLQEVDICRRLGRGAIRILDLCLALGGGGLRPRKREDELRVLARGFRNPLVCL